VVVEDADAATTSVKLVQAPIVFDPVRQIGRLVAGSVYSGVVPHDSNVITPSVLVPHIIWPVVIVVEKTDGWIKAHSPEAPIQVVTPPDPPLTKHPSGVSKNEAFPEVATASNCVPTVGAASGKTIIGVPSDF
jgi:hypothetical protein